MTVLGYVVINKESLTKDDYETYRSFYCGLCEKLQEKFGRAGQMTLNYDMTFVALLLTALYEPDVKETVSRCVVHPLNKREHRISTATDYAADMNLLLSYEKCMDDWKDEGSALKHAQAQKLEKFLPDIRKRYPEKVAAIQADLKELYALEDAKETDIDKLAACYGRVFAKTLAWKHDVWERPLYDAGICLGKFVYLADAFEDLAQDEKKGRFNCLAGLKASAGSEEDYENLVFAILNGVMGDAVRSISLLPIIDYVPIVNNILYAGVWTRPNAYRAKLHRKEQA